MSKGKRKKRDKKIEDIKERNLGVVEIINRGGKGPHTDKKKEQSKKQCRRKIDVESE